MLTPMQQARSNFGIVFSPERVLYAMGGEYYGDRINALSSIECISLYKKNSKWRYLTPMPHHFPELSAAFLRGRIFVVGGNESEFKWLRDVAMFTPPKENDETSCSLGQWTHVDDLPPPNLWGIILIVTSKSIIAACTCLIMIIRVGT